MKVAIVAFANMKYSPYVKTYSDYLDKKGVEYNVIYPKREKIDDNLSGKHYPIEWNPRKNKFWNFLAFRREASKILKENKYDFVFVLTTFPAVLLASVLKRHYKGRYLVDIRDYTHENNKIYFHYEKKALRNSKANVISSVGFKRFLPEGEYLLCHNMPGNYTNPKVVFRKATDKIIIGYVGTIGYKTHCRKLIDFVKNDERFCFYFHGNEKGDKSITSYVNELQNERIKCFGPYDPNDKFNIIESVDILFNVYGNQSQLVKCAVSNKLYDSFYFKKPLLTSSETIMSDLAGEYSYDLDLCTDNIDKIYEWYNSINADQMIVYMNEKINQNLREMHDFYSSIDKFLEGLN